MKSHFKFRVPGGLGNQLFSYFCAIYVANVLKSKSLLDLRSVDTSHFRDGIALLSLDFPQDYVSISNERRSDFFLSPLYERLHRQVTSLVNPALVKTFEPGHDSKGDVDRYLESFDNNSPKSRTINGYFADFAFYDCLSENTRLLRLRQPTSNFKLLSKSFDDHRTIAIHHRLGDFLGLGQSVGILSRKYYLDALDRADFHDFEKVVVFSNDQEMSRFLLNAWGVESKRFTWLGPEDLVNPTETMLLMAKACSIISSNSTFSFWAAKLSSENSCKVYFPSQFRKDDFVSIQNLPKHWAPIDSNWMNKDA